MISGIEWRARVHGQGQSVEVYAKSSARGVEAERVQVADKVLLWREIRTFVGGSWIEGTYLLRQKSDVTTIC